MSAQRQNHQSTGSDSNFFHRQTPPLLGFFCPLVIPRSLPLRSFGGKRQLYRTVEGNQWFWRTAPGEDENYTYTIAL
jgi:hypothetical protein